ncbi:MAG: hypothetical protein Q9172_001058 [Xanthocarpia lactea]
MSDLCLDARLRFLDRSARLLDGAAPATSAHLMLERNTVAEEHGRALNKSLTKNVCMICGTVLIGDIASGSDVIYPDITGSEKKNKAFPPEHVSLGKQTEMECPTCRRVTVKSILPSQWHNPEDVRTTARTAGSLRDTFPMKSKSDAVYIEKTTPANVSSKRRAKARKQAGLQAMLEKAKGTNSQPSDFGLSLMDLIKPT